MGAYNPTRRRGAQRDTEEPAAHSGGSHNGHGQRLARTRTARFVQVPGTAPACTVYVHCKGRAHVAGQPPPPHKHEDFTCGPEMIDKMTSPSTVSLRERKIMRLGPRTHTQTCSPHQKRWEVGGRREEH